MLSRFFGLAPRNVERDRAVLTEIVRRIVDVAQPEQVILFGSAARGRLRPDSDFDLLVVKSGVPDTRDLTRRIYAHLYGIHMPVDVIVATPEDIQASRYKMLGRIYYEGRRLYPHTTAARWE